MRRVARLAAFLLVLLAVVATSAYFTLTSARFEQQVRDRLWDDARRAGIELEDGRLELRPLRLGASLHGVTGRLGDGATVSVRRIGIRFALAPLLRGEPRLGRVVIEGATLDLDLGRLRLPESQAGGRSPLDGVVLELADCTVRLHRASLDAELRDLDASIRLDGDGAQVTAAFLLPRLDLADNRFGPGRVDLALRYAPTALTIERFNARLRTGDITTNGRILLPANELELTLATDVSLAAVSAILRDPTLLDGTATLTGALSGNLAHPRFAGTGTLDRLALRNEPILHELTAEVMVSPDAVRLVGGRATLDTGDPVELRGEARLSGDAIELVYRAPRIAVPGLARRFPDLPFVDGELHAEGEVHIPFEGSVRIDARAQVSALVPTLRAQSDDPRLRHLYGPFDGAVDLSFQDDVFHIARADLHGNWGRLVGDGAYGLAGNVDFCAQLLVNRLRDLTLQEGPMPPWLERPPEMWLDGTAIADLTWRGAIDDLDIQVTGTGDKLGLLSDGDGSSIVRSELGDASFDLAIRGDHLTWSTTVAGAVAAEASGTTEIGAEGIPSRHDIELNSAGWSALDFGRLLAMPGREMLSGPMRLDLHLLGGSDGEWTARTRLTGSPTVGGTHIEELRASLTSDERGLAVEELEARAGPTAVSGCGILARDPLPIDFELNLVALELGPLFAEAPTPLLGSLSARTRITGTSTDWRLSSALTVLTTNVGGLDLGEVSASIEGDPSLVRIDLLSDSDRDLWADITPREPYPFRATASFDQLALAPIWRMLSPTLSVAATGEASGAVVATGNLLGPDRLEKVTLELTSAVLDVKDYRLRIADTVHVVLSPDGVLRLGKVELAHGEDRISLSGVVDLTGTQTDVTVSGRSDLQLLRTWYPDLVASGPIEIDARVRDGGAGPNASGTVAVTDGYLRTTALPYPLRDLTALGRLEGRKVEVTGASARFGGGVIHADVALDLDAETLEATASGQDVRFTLFQDLEIRASPRIHYTVSKSAASLSGTLEVERAIYHMRPGVTGGKLATPELGLSGFGNTELDLRIVAKSNLWLVSEEARIEGDAELHVRGTAAAPVVLGSIRYLSQDKLTLDGREYRVVRGTLSFDNPSSLDPNLDFEAQSSLQGYDVVIGISGPLSAPRVHVSSNPPLAETSVLALLGGGTADQALGVSSLSGGQEILYQLLLPRTLSGLIPRVSVSAAALRGRRDPTEVFPVSIRLPRNIDITVGIPRREAAAELVIVDWKPFPSYTLSLIRDLDRSWGGEALVERRFGNPARAVPAPTATVTEVHIDGIDADLAALVADPLETRAGVPLSQTSLRHDVEQLSTRLRDHGYPLARVEPTVEELDDRAQVRFAIDLGRKVEIAVSGDHAPRGLSERLFEAVQAFGLYSETEGELERVTREAYEKSGYANGLVSCERGEDEHQDGVRFQCSIEPGVRVELREIRFEGVHSLAEDLLLTALRSRPSWFKPARIITSEIESDIRAIAALYRADGFLHATTRGELRPQGDRATTLVVHVDEGPRFQVGSVHIEGASSEHVGELEQSLVAKPGSPYRPDVVAADRERILEYYGRLGHLEARVEASVAERDEETAVNVTFRVDEATPIRLGAIHVLGLNRTRPAVVTSTLGLRPDDLLSYSALARARRRLYDLGVFRSVQIEPVAADYPDRRDLEVRVEETAPYRLELGGGFDSSDGLRAVASLTDINFTGRGRLLTLQLRASRSEGRGQVLLREPRFFGSDWSALVTAFSEWRDEISFDSRDWVLRSEVEHAFDQGRRTRFALRYSLSKTDLKNVAVTDIDVRAEERLLSSIGLALVHDRRDDIIEPQNGLFASADLEWASRFLGSQQDFVKLAVKGFRYQRLRPGLVWASGFQLGLGFPIDDDQLPLAQRYFAGGGSSLRGIGFNLAGPLDPVTSRPTGGSAVLVMNQELRFNLFGPIIGSIFLDVGDVYARPADLTRTQRWSLGAGLRYRAAIVAGFDYARLLDRRPGEAADQLRFSLGYAF